jgi:hypothetical protein
LWDETPIGSLFVDGVTREVASMRIDPGRVRAVLTSNGMIAFLGAVVIAVLVARLYGG